MATCAACTPTAASNGRSGSRPTSTPSSDRAPVVMFLGDSYTAGGRESPPTRTYAADTARLLGWQVIVGGRGGTGFATPGSAREPFATLFARQLAWRPAPDMLIVSGGHNDRNRSAIQVGIAARDLLARAKARWPGTHLVLIGPMWGTGTPMPSVLGIRDALEGVAHETGIPFIDPLREQWVTGDRRDGTGNAAHYILPDRVHPTPEGHRYIATRLAGDLKRLGLTRPMRRL
ncbi:SGNH/GDSL hydrolase family protein [Actinomadura sp. HBU206391]|nr:SGNH/GDSL hydrolase family protein [Actinomadura sp. HBU206391]